MSREEMMAAILNAINDDAKLLQLLRMSISHNLPNADDTQLTTIYNFLAGL